MLSALVLPSLVGRHRWSAVAIGLSGVIVMRPGGGICRDRPRLAVPALRRRCVTITCARSAAPSDPTIVLWFTS